MKITDYKKNIDETLALRKYDPGYIPNSENIVLTIDNKHTGSLQNFVVISGLPKAGKSTFISAIISSAFVPFDVFTMKIHLPQDRRRICYFDTESSDYDFYRQINKIKGFSQLTELPDNFDAYQVREDSSLDIKKLIDRYLELTPDCSILVIDGLLDLLNDSNDTTESSLLTKWLKKITKIYNILVITVLHQSKSNLSTTGHIGSATDRFAQSTLDIVKDKDKNMYILSSRFMRSDSDFESVTLMNFNGIFEQVDNEKTPGNLNKASDMTERESHLLCQQIVTSELFYDDIIKEVIERTAKSKGFAKNLVKIWITNDWIIKNQNLKYKIKLIF